MPLGRFEGACPSPFLSLAFRIRPLGAQSEQKQTNVVQLGLARQIARACWTRIESPALVDKLFLLLVPIFGVTGS